LGPTSPAADLGEGLIGIRERGIDALEAVFAEGVRADPPGRGPRAIGLIGSGRHSDGHDFHLRGRVEKTLNLE